MTQVSVDLTGVPETLLWNLHHRALEARRPDTVLHDPVALDAVASIDYPFDRFGSNPHLAEAQGLRAQRFDREVRRFLRRHPDGTVVALGEGLETAFWRVDNGRVRWVTVDVPEAVAVRRQVLPEASDRQEVRAMSAVDEKWMDGVDSGDGVMITAQGLLMYLDPAEAHQLIVRCSERFPGATMVFDAIPGWFSAMTRKGAMKSPGGYQSPGMPWAANRRERAALRSVRTIAELDYLPLARGRSRLFAYVVPLAARTPGVRYQLPFPWIMRARFLPA